MTSIERLEAFAQLGKKIATLDPTQLQQLHTSVVAQNNWFSAESVNQALQGIMRYLDPNQLQAWSEQYKLPDTWTGQKVGVIMAGNIPGVGFHDFLSVLISGHTLLAMTSSKDSQLIRYLVAELIKIAPAFEDHIIFPPLLKEADAFIATGSDNSARHFEYYFSSKPHIIRYNRIGVSILNGQESTEDFRQLGKDIFTYYGLGCRNVAKIYVPQGYDFVPLYEALESFKGVIDNHKYANNYEYNKAIYLVKRVDHLDNGFLLLKEDTAIASPCAVLFYEYYTDQATLSATLEPFKDKIQCITSQKAWFDQSIELGQAQQPGLNDYADGVDTMAFLEKL